METALQLVGGSVLSAFLQVLFDRMAKPEFLNLFCKHKCDDHLLKKLKWKLLILQGVLEDAENKQSKSPAVKEWLDELQEIYQADDLLDQINNEALRIKVESQYLTRTNLVSTSTPPSNFGVEFLKETMPRLEEIVEELQDFEQKIGILGLINKVESKRQQFRLSPTFLVENDVCGRDADKEQIIQSLFSDVANGENVSVISVVGLGGVGKTTLAQFAYNDERVNKQFDTKAWVCVSEEYDLIRITRELLGALNISFVSEEGVASLQLKLQQALWKKRFLLVLDDIWNRDYNDWRALSAPFSGGKEGSKVIVTTRDEKVALMISNRHNIHSLNPMSEEHCWLLFQKHSFSNIDDTRKLEFEEIGKEIMKKCGGLPLAIIAIAGLLRSKDTIEEWNEILTSDEWSQANFQAGVLPSLRLSYAHLSSHLKRCFAYCAVFHKDYLFSEDEIILLWMANDLLESPKGKKRLEDIGKEFLHELKVRSLFQQSSDGKYFMHDLVNDLAKFVSGKHFLRLEDQGQQNSSSSVVRHFSYLSNHAEALEFKPLKELKCLRTFLPICFSESRLYGPRKLSQKLFLDVLPTSKSLRVLSLCGYRITELPNSLAVLKQLRFLNLSSTRIRRLPTWICTFCNLQTLLLVGCGCLKEFPEDMEKLINLRYLDVREVQLTKMPMEIGRLENLQFLSSFIVSKHGGSRIEALGKLCNLQGEFNISGLENVANGKSASMSKMKAKKHIKQLTLKWTDDCDNSQVAQDVFRYLEPHSEIELLRINGYCGTRFPNWLQDPSSFCYIVSLSIFNCKNCFCLPAIGQLPSLGYLSIHGLSKVINIGSEIYGAKPFPCLKKLIIQKMEEWKEWHIPGNRAFSYLEELYIRDCPELKGEIPNQLPSLKRCEISCCPKLIVKIQMQLPLLENFKIKYCPGLVSTNGELSIFHSKADFSTLRQLEIYHMPNLKKLSSLSSELNELFPCLEKLCILKCKEMVFFPITGLPTTFRRLEIGDAGDMQLGTSDTCHVSIEELAIFSANMPHDRNLSLSSLLSLCHLDIHQVSNIEELSIPTSLQSLEIRKCQNLMVFTVGELPAPYLTTIKLCDLPKLKSFPERMDILLPSLKNLELLKCPEIECFQEGGLPSSLQSLEIKKCERLCRSWKNLGLHKLPSLTTLEFYDYQGEDETFPPEDLVLPSTLRSLELWFHENLEMLNYGGLQRLTSLQSLSIFNCPMLRCLSKEGLPTSLSRLEISYCPKLQMLTEWRLPASLSALHIDNCPELQSLSNEGLPVFLSKLEIHDCPKLQSLPEQGLPAFLSKLHISDCPLLKQRLEGEDWPKVEHIPCIEIDGEFIPCQGAGSGTDGNKA